uniref:WD-40 repeat protein n=1 Tax=Cyanothece sp. (strain PCC 7425 / ATCC 29141) TaxID=395961 RepID=B8HM86_CYAP4
MTVEEAIELVEVLLERGRLTKVQEIVFRQSWEGKTYAEMAKNYQYDAGYLKDLGSELWRSLSEATGEKVTKSNLPGVLKRIFQRRNPLDTLSTAKEQLTLAYRDWGDAPDIPVFFGRIEELAILENWIIRDRCRCVAIIGMRGIGKTQLSMKLGLGGIGKTDLSLKLAQGIQEQFEFVIWRSLLNAPPLADLLADLIKVLSRQQQTNLPEVISERISCLIQYLKAHRCLLILDNAETLLQAGDSMGRYRADYKDYGQLLKQIGEVSHQSCLLLTSREKPQEFILMDGPKRPVRTLVLQALGLEAGKQVVNELGEFTATAADWQELIQLYNGNPLALQLAGKHILEVFFGHIADFLRDGKPVFHDLQELLDWHFQRLPAACTEVLYWLAINREPISLAELRDDLLQSTAQAALPATLGVLQRKIPLEHTGNRFTLQPVLLEYVTDQLVACTVEEILNQRYDLLRHYALIKAQSKDYIRQAQIRIILEQVIDRLMLALGHSQQIQVQLQSILKQLKQDGLAYGGYGAGNLLNILRQIQADFCNYDFSGLPICQAYLQNIQLQNVNFSNCHFSKTIFTQAFGGMLAVDFSPNGQTLATADTNGGVHLWQLVDQQRLLTLKGHTNWIRRVVFSPDGQLLASASDDGTVRIWQLSSGQCLHTLSISTGSEYAVAFSPDGSLLASCGIDANIKIWLVSEGRLLKVLTGHSNGLLAVHFSPDGQRLASGGYDTQIKIWDIETGSCLYTLTDHENWIGAANFSSNGAMLVSASCDGTVRIWDTQNYQCLEVLRGHTGWVWRAVWSRDDRLIASCSADRTLRIWDVETGTCLHTLKGHDHQIWGIAFSPDHQMLASASEDQTIRLWQVSNGQCMARIQGYTNWIKAVAFSPNDQLLASGHRDRSLRIWDRHRGECIRQLSGFAEGLPAVAFHPNSTTIAGGSQDATIKLWDLKTGECSHTFTGHTDEVWSLAFSPDGQLLASSSFDHTVKLWDLNLNECCQTLEGHRDRVAAVAFSPEGKILASGSDDCTIRLWDLQAYRCINVLEGHTARIGPIAFSPEGNLLVSPSLDQTLKVWDMRTGECLRTLQGHSSWVMAASFSPDGQTLASASCDQTVKIWDVSTGQCLTTLSGHSNWIWSVAFSQDGLLLASASEDETIRLWDLGSGRCLRILKAKRPYEGMKITGATGLSLAQTAMLRELGAV